jgi:hypothetical protein
MHISRAIVLLAVVATALVGCKNATVAPTTAAQPVISVAERPTMIRVISQRSGAEITPGIDIFADGHCRVRTFRGEELEQRLRPSDVHDLLDFFDRQGLFSISNESIERAIDRELQPIRTELPDGSVSLSMRGRAAVVDANHTRIAARTSSKKVDISRYALDSELEDYRTVAELRTVQRCVQRVYEVAGKIAW